MEIYFILVFICTVCIFLTRSKVGSAILLLIIVILIVATIGECSKAEKEEQAHEGKVQIYHNGNFEWVTPEEQHAIYKAESEEHYRQWAAEHPEEAEKDRIRDSISRAHYGYGTRSIYDPK